MIKIRREDSANFRVAQKFYSSVDYHTKIEPSDIVFSAVQGEEIVGAVRLSREFNHLVLRGMMIAPFMQRQGVGTKMLAELENCIGDEDCWCLPRGWLEGFYGQIGFKRVVNETAPQHLQERVKSYLEKYPDMFIMKR